MKSAAPIGLATITLLVLTGCTGLTGRWRYQSIKPSGAERHMAIRCITFDKAGTYTAESLFGGQLVSTDGTYTWDPKTYVVVLRSEKGEQTYRADVCGPCSTLQFWNVDDPERWRATFVARDKTDTDCAKPVKK